MKIADVISIAAPRERNLTQFTSIKTFFLPLPFVSVDMCELVTGNVRSKLKTNFRDMRVHTEECDTLVSG